MYTLNSQHRIYASHQLKNQGVGVKDYMVINMK